MKKIALYIGFFALLLPTVAMSDSTLDPRPIPCSEKGYTVVFVNGILDTQEQAKEDASQLEKDYRRSSLRLDSNEPVTFQLGYNPSHLAGAGDLAQSVAQEFSYSVSDYDLQTILLQIYPEVTTRKVLLVGHSQGAYYTGELYNYLINHGVPKESLAVYDVGSPAPSVAGGGKYLNASDDLLLTLLRDGLHFNVLPSNVYLPFNEIDNKSVFPGHAFINAYLAGASDRIVSDISGELSALVPTFPGEKGGCFTPPASTLGYQTQRAIFAVADPTAVAIKDTSVAGVTGAIALGNAGLNAVSTAFNYLSDLLPAFTMKITDTPHTTANFKMIKTIYGSSLDEQDVKDLLGNSQGGAVVLALRDEVPLPINGGFVEGTSTEAPPIVATSTAHATSTGGSTATSSQKKIDDFILKWLSGQMGGSSNYAAPQSASTAPAVAVDESTTSATSSADVTATSTDDSSASSTTTVPPPPPPPVSQSSAIIASQTDFSGTPSHYWSSDGGAGSFLVTDPNDGQPGYPLGALTATDSNVVGIHLKLLINGSNGINQLPRIPMLYDESGAHMYACAQMPYAGYAYGTAQDAMNSTTALSLADWNGKMVDLYFQCYLGVGHDQVFAGTQYRLLLSPISVADVFDIYVAMNAAGSMPYFELSRDGTF